jgi:hypothetical protein
MAFVEIDHVSVDKDLWARVLSGDEAAKRELRHSIVGLELYCHALSVDENSMGVTLQELEHAGVIEHVIIGPVREEIDHG